MHDKSKNEVIDEVLYPDLECLLDDPGIGPLLRYSRGPERAAELHSDEPELKRQFRWITIDQQDVLVVADRLEELGRVTSAMELRDEHLRREMENEIRIISLRTIKKES